MRNCTVRLTQADGQRSVIKEMLKATRIRIASWPLRALSLLTIVALLVAPTCAPLCAGQNCRRADASATANESCHRAGTAHHDALFVHGIRNCNLLESPAIVSTYATLSGISGESRLSASDEQFLAVEQETSVPATRFSDSWFCRPHDFSSGFAAVRSGVLRI